MLEAVLRIAVPFMVFKALITAFCSKPPDGVLLTSRWVHSALTKRGENCLKRAFCVAWFANPYLLQPLQQGGGKKFQRSKSGSQNPSLLFQIATQFPPKIRMAGPSCAAKHRRKL
ncbi:MAG: hypothetical protein J0I19_02380 [Alphaproteobacteria bacterium]|nr:hypothetical protein [Alphaproteobacteria bacterium]